MLGDNAWLAVNVSPKGDCGRGQGSVQEKSSSFTPNYCRLVDGGIVILR